MGVHGLWKLIEASGKPVPIETLESKVLAVDVSIWLHQVVKGFQDSRGNPLPNAHLLGLFHRICKLLFYKIRPVFVFDGGVPHLKKLTVVARRQQKNRAQQSAEQTREKILRNLIKHKALKKALGDKASDLLLSAAASTSVSGEDDMFHISASQVEYEVDDPISQSISENEDSEEDDVLHGGKYRVTDLHTMDVDAAEFKALPANVRHDILSELKETRKQSSWGKLHEIPKEQGDFSSYQMNRLLKRRAVQVSLEEAEKEMGGRTLSLGELEELLKDQGVTINSEIGRRIASDNVTRFVYMKDSPQSSPDKKMSSGSCTSSPEKKMSSDSCTSTPEKPPKACESSKVMSKITILDSTETSSSNKMDLQAFITGTDSTTNIKVPDMSVVGRENLSDLLDLPTGGDKSVEEIETKLVNHKSISFVEMESNFVNSVENSDEYEEESDEDVNVIKKKPEFQLAHSFMFENSGLTQKQILKIIKNQGVPKTKHGMSHDLISKDIISLNDMCSSETVASTSKMPFETLASTSKTPFKAVAPTSKIASKSVAITSETPFETVASTSKTPFETVASTSKTPYLDYEVDNEDDLTQQEILSLISYESTRSVVTENQNNDTERNKITFEEVNISNKASEDKNMLPDKSEVIFKNQLNNEQVLNTHEPQDIEIVSEKSGSLNESQFDTKHEENSVVTSKNESNITLKANSGGKPDLKPSVITSGNETFEKADMHSKINKTENIEIVIKCDTQNSLENDIFADVFSTFPEQDNKIVKDNLSVSEGKKNVENETDVINCVETSINVGLIGSSGESDDENPPDVSSDTEMTDLSKAVSKSDSCSAVKQPESVTNVADLILLQDTLEQKHADLLAERGKQERLAASITDQMVLEAQELLQLFGIPYIVAPMEAEAQCAFLDSVGLTEGTITDDSDIWLFGGRLVYKNFFSMKKEVMQFKFTDIHHYFKLTREQLVLLALLVGSDYTEGLQGVGPVTALEILASFPIDANNQDLLVGLKKFSEWFNSGKLVGPGKTILRNKLKNVHLMQGFPNQAVVNAYLHPEVDESKEKFSWAAPNLSALKEYAKTKFRWTPKKTEEILMPVMKKLSESKFQKSLNSYFKTYKTLDSGQEKMSKRVRNAIRTIANEDNSDDVDDPEPKKAKISHGKSKRSQRKIKKLSNPEDMSTDEPASSCLGVTTLSCADEPSGNNSDVPQLSSEDERSCCSSGMIAPSSLSLNHSLSGAASSSSSSLSSRTAGIRNPPNPCSLPHARKQSTRTSSGTVTVPLPHPRTKVKPEGKFLPKVNEFIPQREKDKMNLLKNKLKAIETFRKSKRGLDRTKRETRKKRPILKEARLSESSSSSNES